MSRLVLFCSRQISVRCFTLSWGLLHFWALAGGGGAFWCSGVFLLASPFDFFSASTHVWLVFCFTILDCSCCIPNFVDKINKLAAPEDLVFQSSLKSGWLATEAGDLLALMVFSSGFSSQFWKFLNCKMEKRFRWRTRRIWERGGQT